MAAKRPAHLGVPWWTQRREAQDRQSRNDDHQADELAEMDGCPIHTVGILGKHGSMVIGIFPRGMQEACEQGKEFPDEQQRRGQTKQLVVSHDGPPVRYSTYGISVYLTDALLYHNMLKTHAYIN